MPFDLVVRNGSIVDGTGRDRYRADIGIDGGRIVEIARIDSSGRREVDADGHVVTPGFIDGHTHMDAQVMWDPLGSSSCWHGVTTVVMGNCGFTLAPAASEHRHLVVGNLERAEDIPAEAMSLGIDWSWGSFPEYLDAVASRPKGINYAGYVGHSALRIAAMGERAFTEEANEVELRTMEGALDEALRAGAIGLSTSRSSSHTTTDGRPVASRLASWDEVTQLVRSTGRFRGAVFEIAQEAAVRSPDPTLRHEYLTRIRELAVTSGATVTFGLVPTTSEGYDWRDLLATLDETSEMGGRMFGQSHSRGVSTIVSFETQMPFDGLPEWASVRTRSRDEQMRAFADEESRRRLVSAAHHGSYDTALDADFRRPDYDTMLVLERGLPPNPTVAELARQQDIDPVELILNLALASEFSQLFAQPITPAEPADVLEIMRHPRTVMTFSDSGAHVSQILDASIQTHLLGYWVRERQEFSFEEAVKMITSVPADVWGFSDRGRIEVGNVADLNVIDPEHVQPEVPEVLADLPGGARRLSQKSAGILSTIVGGEEVFSRGSHTGALPGKLLRSSFSVTKQ